MWNLNNGYVGRRMSVRAQAAYDSGQMPMSKWTKAALEDAIENCDDDLMQCPKELLTKLPASILREHFLNYCGWHHTGKFFRETHFYEFDEGAACDITTEEVNQILKEHNQNLERARRKRREYNELFKAAKQKMKNNKPLHYKDFPQRDIGKSSEAALIMVGNDEEHTLQAKQLKFTYSCSYHAYLVLGDNVEIGRHYNKVATFLDFIKIYDDHEVTCDYKADTIHVYRAAAYGCIIQLIGSNL